MDASPKSGLLTTTLIILSVTICGCARKPVSTAPAPRTGNEDFTYNACVAINSQGCIDGIASLSNAQRQDLIKRFRTATCPPASASNVYRGLFWQPFLQGYSGIAQHQTDFTAPQIANLKSAYSLQYSDRMAFYQKYKDLKSKEKSLQAKYDSDKATLDRKMIHGGESETINAALPGLIMDTNALAETMQQEANMMREASVKYAWALPVR